jgi:hypothetical protein
MNRWLCVVGIAGSLFAGCIEERAAGEVVRDDEAVEVLAQVAAGTGVLGTPCKVNADCQGGANARCLTTVALLNNMAFPGGFCTTLCRTNTQCTAGGQCPLGSMVGLAQRFIPDAGAAAAEISTCMKSCTTQADCRTGYSCAALPASPLMPGARNPSTFCQPPMPDGGLPTLPGAGGLPGFPRP